MQVDFSMPERLGASYIAEDGSKKVPVMLHRAIVGSLERFIGILIEETAGNLAVWLSPVQVVVMNITDAQANAVEKITLALRKLGLRVEEDLRNEKIGFKIREHSIQRVPYLLIVGDREATSGQVAVRTREGTDLGVMSLQDFSDRILAEATRHSYEIKLEE
jgi:threonyl-tRNA synthetase